MATSSSGGSSVLGPLTITLNDVNEAPVIEQGDGLSIETVQMFTNVATLTASDAGANDTLSWELAGPNAGLFSIDANGTLSWQTAPVFDAITPENNIVTVSVVARDGAGLTDTIEVTVNVLEHWPLVLVSEPQLTPRDEDMPIASGTQIYTVTAQAQGSTENITYQLITGAQGGTLSDLTIDENTGVVTTSAPSTPACFKYCTTLKCSSDVPGGASTIK